MAKVASIPLILRGIVGNEHVINFTVELYYQQQLQMDGVV
jgi:hypothetical protein